MDNNNDSTNKSITRDADAYLKHVTELSHKISKPIRRPSSSSSSTVEVPSQPSNNTPVYNINKSDFRDVVQRLTGVAEPVIDLPVSKRCSSRLQKIRPPPLPQISNLVNDYASGFREPMSPLPPFPSVHASAESPISAYMRFYHNSVALPASSPTQKGH